MKKDEVTTSEILEFLQENVATKEDLKAFATKEDLARVENRLDSFATKEDLQRGLNKLELKMLDGMDDKLADLKGDLVVMMRKGDRKLANLIGLLLEKELISKDEAGKLLALEPFPQM